MIPGQHEPIVDGDGRATPRWYGYLRSLAVQAVAQAVAIPTFQALWGEMIGYGLLVRNSIGIPVFRKIAGTAGRTVVTNGDGNGGDPTVDLATLADSGAGALKAVTRDAYGRISGTKAATITGTAGRVSVANGDASAGLPTIDLATVTDAGGGTLQKTAFDTYGRKTGTSAATTTDLSEGTNLYYTDARADARVAAGITGKANTNAPAFTGLVNAANDAAAASGGVAIGSVYRNGSVLMIRVV